MIFLSNNILQKENERNSKFLLSPLFFIPVINIIADVTINLYKPIGIIRGVIILLFLLYFIFTKYKPSKISNRILFFLTFLFFLSLISSNIIESLFNNYIKWFESLLMFAVGYYYIKNENDIYIFLKSLIVCAFIICLNLLFAQIFDIGISAYLEDNFYLGYAGVGITNSLALILITLPIYFYQRKPHAVLMKFFVPLIALISLIFLLVATKRAAIIGLSLGILVYIIYSPRKTKIIKYTIIIAFLLFITSGLYFDTLKRGYEARTTERNEIENESRYQEFFYVLKEMKEGSIFQVFFGVELFNSKQFFGPKYFGQGRMIHGDISQFLYGSGIIGLSLYLSIFILIYRQGTKFFRFLRNNNMVRIIYTSLIGVLLCSFFISVTGSGTIGERTIAYLFMGGAISIIHNYYFRLKNVKTTEKEINKIIK
ncbi:MAG: hypothetical protein A2041_09585 [Bacteroidetes bacterium GWA2_31_9b]|nr:MAG: hypothetical protein A2041_09585 [Bacteroidetes bacterium GWA2_31_9b]